MRRVCYIKLITSEEPRKSWTLLPFGGVENARAFCKGFVQFGSEIEIVRHGNIGSRKYPHYTYKTVEKWGFDADSGPIRLFPGPMPEPKPRAAATKTRLVRPFVSPGVMAIAWAIAPGQALAHLPAARKRLKTGEAVREWFCQSTGTQRPFDALVNGLWPEGKEIPSTNGGMKEYGRAKAEVTAFRSAVKSLGYDALVQRLESFVVESRYRCAFKTHHSDGRTTTRHRVRRNGRLVQFRARSLNLVVPDFREEVGLHFGYKPATAPSIFVILKGRQRGAEILRTARREAWSRVNRAVELFESGVPMGDMEIDKALDGTIEWDGMTLHLWGIARRLFRARVDALRIKAVQFVSVG